MTAIHMWNWAKKAPPRYMVPAISSYVVRVPLPSLRHMSTVIIEKVATAIRCTCGHLWLTASKSRYPTCPVCHSTISRKKHAVILESDTTRKVKQIAESGGQIQNTASTEDLIDNGILQDR
jgi:hypothetical protein